jgi:hypothetical protein
MSDAPPPPDPGAGWYAAPGEARTKRYWDGERWTNERLPMYVDPQSEPQPSSQPAQVAPEEQPSSWSVPEPEPLTTWQVWSGRIERGLSIRVVCLAILAGFFAGFAASFISEALVAPAIVIVMVGAWLAAVLNDEQMMRCDACLKRVKMGATTCHHCGYSRV